MAFSWRWLPTFGLVLAAFAGCGKSSSPPGKSAGKTSMQSGGTTSEGGEGGDGTAGSLAGSTSAGRGGSSSGAGFVGGAGGVGGSGGQPSTAGTGGSGASAGTTTMVPKGWSCVNTIYGDGTCDCGCGIQDVDCARDDRIGECERCGCVGGCPGRTDPDDTTQCLTAPDEWTCSDTKYGDGESCDCGCGIIDLDCDDEGVDSCDACYQFGSCANGVCPSNLTEGDNSRCDLPEDWLCESFLYGDGNCDCGCGVRDLDCKSEEPSSCLFCPATSCTDYTCANLAPDDNSKCTVAPPTWYCAARLWNDGSQCDCGCGYRDPDCASNDIELCDKCNDTGSCSGQACPGTIDETAIDRCIQPPPPEGWTCPAYFYADGGSCDCGCGVPDADCRTDNVDACYRCPGCGNVYCPDAVDPEDTTRCLPPPEGWSCDPGAYTDGLCDCGCGIVDPSCAGETSLYCQNCIGCAEGRCDRVDPEHNAECVVVPEGWTCLEITFSDSVCDCGCGARDIDCTSLNKSVCEYCNSEGSCSELLCTSPNSDIDPTDNTRCN